MTDFIRRLEQLNGKRTKHIIMKKTLLFLYFVSSILLLNAQNYTLKDIVEGRFTAKDIRQMESSADGMHYYQMDPGNTAVIKFS